MRLDSASARFGAAVALWVCFHPVFFNKLTKTRIAIGAVAISFATNAASQNITEGEKAFQSCLRCHAIGENAKNRFGPQLNGLDGRRIGTAPNYRYSDGYKNSDIFWDEDTFVEYIRDPKFLVPGSKMTFRGIKNEQEARDLWGYLARFNSDGTLKSRD